MAKNMLHKSDSGSYLFATQLLIYSLAVVILFLPKAMMANGSSTTDSVWRIKSECYELLGAKDYEGFLRKIELGKKSALAQKDTSNFIEFLTFEGEYYYMRESRGKVIPIFRKILSIVDAEYYEYVNICNHLAHAYNSVPNSDSALFFINKALDSKNSTGFEKLMNYKTKGDVYQSSGEYAKAIQWILKGINGAESLEIEYENDLFQKENFLINSFGELGDLFMLIGDTNATKTYVKRAIALGEKLGLQKSLSRTLNHLGDILLAQNQIDSALYYYQKAYEELDLASASDLEFFKYYRNMFLGNLRKGKLSEAEHYRSEFKNYFEKLTKSLLHSYNIRPGVIDLTLDIDAINLDVDTVILLGLIVNELITNALKYAFPNKQKGSIHIELKEVNEQLILKVEDNGIGFDSKSIGEESSSFGFKIIQAFKEKLDAELEIESDNGTTVFFTIREYKIAG